MSDSASQLLKTLCTGLGEGNTNTEKLTNMILESDPQRDYNSTKIEIQFVPNGDFLDAPILIDIP